MNPIRVCFFSLYAYRLFNPKSESRFGGAEIQLYYLAVELAKDSNFEVSFIVGDFGQPDIEVIAGVRLYKFVETKSRLKYIRALVNIVELMKVLKKIGAEIFIKRAAGLESGIIGLYCGFTKKKFIYMAAHDQDLNLQKPEWMPSGLSGTIKWALFKKGLKKADVIIVQHEAQKKDLQKNYGRQGILRNSAHLIPEELKGDLSGKSAILWLARCDTWKNPELFIDLAGQFSKEKFIMICQPGTDINYFQKVKIKALAVGNIQFIEFVPFNEKDSYFAKAKIFINTSRSEGFANTFIDAAKNKTPILSLSNNPEGMLEKFDIGRCANGDFNKLKSDLDFFLNNNVLWQKTAQNCYNYAVENHDLKKIVEKDKEIILSLFEK